MKFKNLKTMLLVGTMAASLALTGCGSSSSANEDAVVKETEGENTSDESTDEVIEDDSTDETVDGAPSEETEGEATETEEAEVTDEAWDGETPEWMQTLYSYLVDEDLESVYSVIEGDSFHTDVAEYAVASGAEAADSGKVYHYVSVAMDEENVLLLFSTDSESYKQVDAAMISVEAFGETAIETYNDLLRVIYEQTPIYAETFTMSDGTISREAYIGSMWYYNLGLEDELIMDLSEYE